MTSPNALEASLEVISGQATQQGSSPASGSRPGQVWSRRRPIGFLSAVSTTGGIAAPLLAGFSLTTVVQITGSQQPPPLADLAVASFAVAAALLLYALQFSALALGFGATPEQRLEYFPESSISDKGPRQGAQGSVERDVAARRVWQAGRALATVAASHPRSGSAKRPHHLADEGQAVLFGPSPEVKDLLQRLDRLIVALETGRQPPNPKSAGEAAKAQDGAPPVRTGPEHSGSDLPTVRPSRP